MRHGDRLELGSITSATVECEPALQQIGTAAAAAPLFSPVQQSWLLQQQQQPEHADLFNQTRKARGGKEQQQQHELVPVQLQHWQQPSGNELLPVPGQAQMLVSDSRYNTWTAGHTTPGSSNSSAGHHKQSLDDPLAAAAAATAVHHRSQGGISHSDNGSSSSSNSVMALRSTCSGPQTQVHYYTGGGLSCSGSSSYCQSSPCSLAAGGMLAPLIMLHFLDCRVEGAVVKMVRREGKL